ncbi:MAG: response regulator transcription factor, partial [Erysipelotrichaceae bacterium]|nr:response regulator transcription factor [Erysipelotrichaceae bacterium]
KADSFIYKNIDLTTLVIAIKNTLEGYSIFPTKSIPKLPNDAELTPKELEILRLICEAKSRKEIAKILYLSEGTIKAYISTILQKTGYDSISKLAIYALSNGYINSKI